MRLMLFFDGRRAILPCRRRVHPPEREAQEVKLSLRNLADACLLFVYRQPQLAHDLAQVMQRRLGIASLAQDHKIIGVGDEPSAEALLKAELLPSQHEPAHVKISQQW